MKELRASCERAGLEQVATYIASGNLVFRSAAPAPAVRTLLADLLSNRFGLPKCDVFIRTPADLAALVAANPFGAAALTRPNHLLVHFLARVPPAETLEALEAFRGPEQMHLAGPHLYVDYGNGVAGSKVTPAFLDRLLRTPATGRNWNTVNKLLEMGRALEG